MASTTSCMIDTRAKLKHQLALEVLRSSGEACLPVAGASMLPTIWPGDLLEVRRQDAAEISPGQVVLIEREGHLVAHRVVEKVAWPGLTLLVTRGDRVREPDPPVSSEEFLGRVTCVLRGRRRIVPRLTRGRRIASWVLSRSEFATRVVLYLARGKQGLLSSEESYG